MRKLVGPALMLGALGGAFAVAHAVNGEVWFAVVVGMTAISGGMAVAPERGKQIAVPDAIDRFFIALAQLGDLLISPYRFVRFMWRVGAQRPLAAAIGTAIWLAAACTCFVLANARR